MWHDVGMGILRRLLGGAGDRDGPADRDGTTGDRAITDEPARSAPPSTADPGDAERAYERELLRAEHDRLDDLQRRQLRYADHAWRPPPQGGPRRADDDEAAAPPDR